MNWTGSEGALNALMGEGWREVVEPALEVRQMTHDGAADDVHAVTLRDGRVAWCSVSLRGVAICLGVEDVQGVLGAGSARSLPRAEFFGLVPYGTRKGWRDQRSLEVRQASRGPKPAAPLEPGAWVVIVARRDVSADDPMSGIAHVGRLASVEPCEVQLGEDAASMRVDPAAWEVRSFAKWADHAPTMWTGRNWFSYGFACKVAGQMAWRASRPKRAKTAAR